MIMMNLNKHLTRSIAMVEIAAKKLYEKKTGKKIDVNATYTVNGQIKVKVVVHGIDEEDKVSSIVATQYLMNDMYIEEVTIPSIIEHGIALKDVSFVWFDAYLADETYSVVGEMAIDLQVDLFRQRNNIVPIDSSIHVKTHSGVISLDCLDCNCNWEELRVA